jgi:hypothetical protein
LRSGITNGLSKHEEDAEDDNYSIDEEDADLEDDPSLQFASIHEQIVKGDAKRHRELEQTRVDSYLQEYLFDTYNR